MASETIRLHEKFAELGIPTISVKGTTLALLAYGDLGMKQAWDVDLVIGSEHIVAARSALEKLGYGLETPLDRAQLQRLTGFAKECIFTNPSLGFAVELHWRLVENRWLLPGVSLASPQQPVSLGGLPIPTLAKEPLFAFLCVHGTVHGWSRLKWLADVAGYVGRDSPAEIERLYRAAAALGAGRAPAVALLLCERLLGLAIPASLAAEIHADRMSVALANSALRCMGWRRGEAEISYLSTPALRIVISHFFLARGRRYLWAELAYKWNSPADRSRWNLPRHLSFLYHLLRIPLWLGRCAKRWWVSA